jgi:hypothetical protein
MASSKPVHHSQPEAPGTNTVLGLLVGVRGEKRQVKDRSSRRRTPKPLESQGTVDSYMSLCKQTRKLLGRAAAIPHSPNQRGNAVPSLIVGVCSWSSLAVCLRDVMTSG